MVIARVSFDRLSSQLSFYESVLRFQQKIASFERHERASGKLILIIVFTKSDVKNLKTRWFHGELK